MIKKSKAFVQFIVVGGILALALALSAVSLGLFGMTQTDEPGSTYEEFGIGALGGNIPDEYREIFSKAGDKWKVQPAFLAALFLAGEHHSKTDIFNRSTTWPNINGPWASSPVGASGPFQFMPVTWGSNKQDGNGDGSTDVMNIWDSSFGAAHLMAMNGAGGNTTDLNKLRDAASRYNSGRPWAVGQTFSETRPYVLRVIQAFDYFYNVEREIVPGTLANFDSYKLYQTSKVNIPIVQSVGCAVTSVSMAVNYMMGNPTILTPNKAWEYYTSNEMMQWGKPSSRPSNIAGKLSHTALSSRGQTPPLNTMKCYLNEGVPIVLGANRQANEGGKIFVGGRTHYVLIIGITSDNNNFILADPAGRNTTYPISSLVKSTASLGTHIYLTSQKRSVCQ